MSSPLVTVLTAVRNGEEHLNNAIESIRSQSFSDWEHIVVDDASEDGTVGLVEKLIAVDPRVRLVRRRERGGPYVAANEGIQQARGAYIARLDADDVALPHRIEWQLDYLRSTGLRACASYCQLITVDGEVLPDIRKVDSSPRLLKWRLCVLRGLVHSSAFVEREAMEEIGGYGRGLVSEDLRLWLDLARRDWLGVVPEVLVYLRRPGGLAKYHLELRDEQGKSILLNHLTEMTGQPWSEEEAAGLRPGGKGASTEVRLTALARWERLALADASLSEADRGEVTRIAKQARWGTLRTAVRHGKPSLGSLKDILVSARALVGSRDAS